MAEATIFHVAKRKCELNFTVCRQYGCEESWQIQFEILTTPLPPSLQPQFPIFSAKLPTYHRYGRTVKQYILKTASQNMKELFLSTNSSAWN